MSEIIKVSYENLMKLNAPFEAEFQSEFQKFLKSGWYVLGDRVRRFEREFSDYIGVDYAVGVASGLDALVIGIDALNLPENSEILVASNAYIACVLSIIRAGHTPILVEPQVATCNIDPIKIKSALSSKTRAIMAVHMYGTPCDMEEIVKIAKAENLYLIEDCAQAHGAEINGKKVGSFGDVSAFSFYPTKNLGALGDGGAVLTNNFELSQRIKSLRNYGSSTKYKNDLIGYNSRLDELQSFILSIKLNKLDEINKHKRLLGSYYNEKLTEKLIKPKTPIGFTSVYHIYNIRYSKRDELKKYLADNNVGSEIHYPIPPHLQDGYRHLFTGKSFPISEEIHRTTLSLPISYGHALNEVMRVVELINEFVNRN